MARNYLLIILRGLSVALFLFLIIQLGGIYNNDIFKIYNILSILGDLRDIFAYLLYIALFGIFTLIFYGIGFVFSLIPGFQSSYFFNFMNSIFSNLVGRWFYFPDLETTSPTLAEALNGLKNLMLSITDNVYMTILQIIVLFMFFFAVRGSYTSNPSDSIKVITFINLLIIIPLFFKQIEIVLMMFGISSSILPEFFTTLLNKDLLKQPIFADIETMTFLEFLTSNIFIVALTMFIYLEFIFQLSYVDKVTMPSLEREKRLNRQINLMHVEAEKAIERIKAVEEMKREQKESKKREITEEQKENEKKMEERLSLSTLMSEGDVKGFSFVSELIAKKKAEKAEKKMMDAMKDTRRVANYLDKLFKQDKEAKQTLTAKTSAPKSSRLVKSTILNMVIRILLVTTITWLCVHPLYVFSSILQAPDSIATSVELRTYEGVLSLLFPIILVIPLISSIIKVTKHSKLKEMLRLEELQRAGLTEEEMQKLEKKKDKVSEEEVKLKQDKDATAHRAEKAARTN